MASTLRVLPPRAARTIVRRVAPAVALPALGWLGYVLFLKRPSNDRGWEYGMETLADITITGNRVHVGRLRDFEWAPDGPRSSAYVERSFDLDRIQRAWLVKEPFTLPPLTGFKGMAHTYFVFDFERESPVAVSVEARRERGESFDAIRGLLNWFELIYVWGTERDLTGSRAVREKNELYMYRLNISLQAAQRLFLHLARVTQRLATQPRFYNSFTSNCTNELAKAANMVQRGAIPPNLALIFPGYSDEVLYKLGFLTNDMSLEVLRQRAYISDVVKANYERPELSILLRSYLGAH